VPTSLGRADIKCQPQGTSIGVADGVGGWVTMGVDPAMFSQALMFHAHRYSKGAWAGEPETDPTQDFDEPVEGWELTPQECIDLAYGGVLREKSVICGIVMQHEEANGRF
jgi:protein phosphatase PTC7